MLSITRFRESLPDISLCPCMALSMCPDDSMNLVALRCYQRSGTLLVGLLLQMM
jgi:hypothetical protein